MAKNNDRVSLTETEFGEISTAMQKVNITRQEAARAESEMGTVLRLIGDRHDIDLAETPYQLLAEERALVKQENQNPQG